MYAVPYTLRMSRMYTHMGFRYVYGTGVPYTYISNCFFTEIAYSKNVGSKKLGGFGYTNKIMTNHH